MYCEMLFCVVASSVDPEGGGGGGGRTPLENHKLYGFQQGISNWTPPPWKSLDPPPTLENVGPLWNLKNDSFLWN